MHQITGHTYSAAAMGQELRQFLRLGTPILIAEALHMSASFVDTIMAGRYSSADLAAVAVGSSLLFPVLILMMGTIMATTPTVAQYFGAKKLTLIGPFVQQSLWLAAILGSLAVGLLYALDPLFDWLDIQDPIKGIGLDYLHAAALSLPAVAIMQSLRSFSEGLGITKPMVYFSLLGLLINIPMNYIFIYGKFGVPEMGGVGCGWATALSMWASVIGMATYVYAKPIYHQCAMFTQFDWPQLKTQMSILKVGLPIGFSIFIEATMFAIVALLLAPLGADIVAAHQLVLNFASICFILPLSIGMALTIRVGPWHWWQLTRPSKTFCASWFWPSLRCIELYLFAHAHATSHLIWHLHYRTYSYRNCGKPIYFCSFVSVVRRITNRRYRSLTWFQRHG